MKIGNCNYYSAARKAGISNTASLFINQNTSNPKNDSFTIAEKRASDKEQSFGMGFFSIFSKDKYLAEVKQLIANGDDLNAIDKSRFTPLTNALLYKSMKSVNLLLQHGADINAPNGHGWRPVMYANDVKTAEFLINKGVNVNACTTDGKRRTPLMITQNIDVAKLLIKHGADVNAADSSGVTPLMLFNDISLVKILLEKGAKVNVANKDGRTPLMLDRNLAIVSMFIQKGADVNAVNNDGYTPLICAIYNNRPDVVKLLIKHGANVNIAQKSGRTPLQLAEIKGNKEIAKILRENGAKE